MADHNVMPDLPDLADRPRKLLGGGFVSALVADALPDTAPATIRAVLAGLGVPLEYRAAPPILLREPDGAFTVDVGTVTRRPATGYTVVALDSGDRYAARNMAAFAVMASMLVTTGVNAWRERDRRVRSDGTVTNTLQIEVTGDEVTHYWQRLHWSLLHRSLCSGALHVPPVGRRVDRRYDGSHGPVTCGGYPNQCRCGHVPVGSCPDVLGEPDPAVAWADPVTVSGGDRG